MSGRQCHPVAQIGLCAVPAVIGVVPMLLFVLQTVIAIGAMSAFVSAGFSTATALAATSLQSDGEGTSGLSVQTVVAAF